MSFARQTEKASSLLCESHKEQIISFCTAKKCDFSPLCSKCIVLHLNTNHKNCLQEAELQNFESLKQIILNKNQRTYKEFHAILQEISSIQNKKNHCNKEFELYEQKLKEFKEFLCKSLDEIFEEFQAEFKAFFISKTKIFNEKLIDFQKKIEKLLEKSRREGECKDFVQQIKEINSLNIEKELEKERCFFKKLVNESQHLYECDPKENNSEFFVKFAKEVNELFHEKFPFKNTNYANIRSNLSKNSSFLSKSSFFNNTYEHHQSNFLESSTEYTKRNDEKSVENLKKKENILNNLLKRNELRSLSPKIKDYAIENNEEIRFNEKEFQKYLINFDKAWNSHKIRVLPLDLCKSVASLKNNPESSETQNILKRFSSFFYETTTNIQTKNKLELSSLKFCFIYKTNNTKKHDFNEYCAFFFPVTMKKTAEILVLCFNKQEKNLKNQENIVSNLKILFSLFLHEKMKNIEFSYEFINYLIFEKNPSSDILKLSICYCLAHLAKQKQWNGGTIHKKDLCAFQKTILNLF